MTVRRWIYVGVLAYLICIVIGYFGWAGYLGALGRAPVAFLGHKSSIVYMYDCFSGKNYNKKIKNYWLKRGAEAEIPEFQRLYGEKLLDSGSEEGLRLVAKAAEANDYYAAQFLANAYESPKFKNLELAAKYKEVAKRLEAKQ